MRFFQAIGLAVALLAVPTLVSANMSYSPWVHEIVQKGGDMEITVQIFDKTTAANGDGEPLPGLDAKYTLKRGGTVLFEDRVFDPEEAEEVTGFVCHAWNSSDEYGECDDETGADGGVGGECAGFCGVAYRYKVVDHCPTDEGELMYWMSVNPPYDLRAEDEGLGFTNTGFDREVAGRECKASSESGCTAVGLVAGRAGGALGPAEE